MILRSHAFVDGRTGKARGGERESCQDPTRIAASRW